MSGKGGTHCERRQDEGLKRGWEKGGRRRAETVGERSNARKGGKKPVIIGVDNLLTQGTGQMLKWGAAKNNSRFVIKKATGKENEKRMGGGV